MKRAILALVVAFGLLLAFLVQQAVPLAHAKTATPLTTTNCGLQGCVATWSEYPITTHGVGSDFTIDNPSIGTGEFYAKSIEVAKDYTVFETAGIEKNGSCGSALWYFYDYDQAPTHPVCYKVVPSQDINTTITIKLSYYASNGGGGFVYILSRSGSSCNPCGYAASNLTTFFNESIRQTDLAKPSFSGHFVWGGKWVNNRYVSDKGTWQFEGNGGTTTLVDGSGHSNGDNSICGQSFPTVPPPDMCYSSYPNGSSNNGGTIYSCEYDSSINDCTQGS
jgi:hypothetical protein